MAKSTKELSKELYLKGFSVNKIAEILNKKIRTIQNYKSSDGKWDEAKTINLMQNAKDDGTSIYSKFTEQMYQAIKEITEDNALNSQEKANALSKVGDSFSKMRNVARLEDPKAYKLTIAREVIKLVVKKFQEVNDKNALKILVELLEDSEFLKSLEGLD